MPKLKPDKKGKEICASFVLKLVINQPTWWLACHNLAKHCDIPSLGSNSAVTYKSLYSNPSAETGEKKGIGKERETEGESKRNRGGGVQREGQKGRKERNREKGRKGKKEEYGQSQKWRR